jgi:thiamine-phosphate pyrophosphorylase
MNPVDIRLYGILDPARSKGRPLAELARAAVKGGVTLLQLRDKSGDIRAMVREAREISSAIAGSGVKLIVNDRVDAALAAGADGVHLGQEDMEAADARRLLGPSAIIGISIKKPDEARALPAGLVDYAFVGGVFDTQSKDNKASVGVEGWREVAAIVRATAPGMPVGAIAGIDETNAGALFKAGADGVALISALCMRDDVEEAARLLAAICRKETQA